MAFFPRNINFFSLFAKQAEQLKEANTVLQTIAGHKDCAKQVKQLKSIEHEADLIAHEIYRELNQTFITPIEREDITFLTSRIDDVIDTIDRAVELIDLYAISPQDKPITQFIKLIDKAVGEVVKGVAALTHLHKSQHEIMKHCELINFIENQVDDVTREVIGNLVNTEKDVIKIIKLKEIYESFEAVADRCEDVANALETIVVKNQ